MLGGDRANENELGDKPTKLDCNSDQANEIRLNRGH